MSATIPLRRAAGEVLMVGLAGPELGAIEAAWLKLIRPSGVILFRRNLEEPAQSLGLFRAIGNSIAAGGTDADPAILRCVDVEGGTVDRLRDMIAPIPSAQAVGETGDPMLFTAHGALVGRELRVAGFNTALAPVLDLRTAASASVMTSRAVSGNPAEVLRYGQCFLDGLAEQGVLGCGKHFPGLGSGSVDSHHVTPRIEKPFSALWKEDLLPFRKLAKQLPMAMISHAVYPKTPSPDEPASVSHFWVTKTLVKKIGFRGLIVSDDMEMGGIRTQTGLTDAVLRSIAAGVDLIEICHDPTRILAGYEALLREAETSPAFARQLRGAANRVLAFRKARLENDVLPEPPTVQAVDSLREQVDRFTAEVSARA